MAITQPMASAATKGAATRTSESLSPCDWMPNATKAITHTRSRIAAAQVFTPSTVVARRRCAPQAGQVEIREFVGVYNADGGVRGEVRYVVGHLLGRAECALCDITHSPVRRKKQWDRFVVDRGVPWRLLHLNEMPADVATLVAQAGSPLVLARTDHGLQVVLTPGDLAALDGSVERFAAALASATAAP